MYIVRYLSKKIHSKNATKKLGINWSKYNLAETANRTKSCNFTNIRKIFATRNPLADERPQTTCGLSADSHEKRVARCSHGWESLSRRSIEKSVTLSEILNHLKTGLQEKQNKTPKIRRETPFVGLLRIGRIEAGNSQEILLFANFAEKIGKRQAKENPTHLGGILENYGSPRMHALSNTRAQTGWCFFCYRSQRMRIFGHSLQNIPFLKTVRHHTVEENLWKIPEIRAAILTYKNLFVRAK